MAELESLRKFAELTQNDPYANLVYPTTCNWMCSHILDSLPTTSPTSDDETRCVDGSVHD